MADQEYNKNKVDQEKAAQGQVPDTEVQGIPASSVQVQPKQRTAQDIINGIFSYQPPKPVYDPKRPEEIKRQMKVNALTEGLKALGDAFALSKGANVNRREPDTQNSQLLGSLHNYIDNYNKNLDTWNYNNYMNRVKKGLTELQQYNTEQQAKANQTKMAYDMAKDQRDYDLKEQKTKADIQLAGAKQKADQAYREAMTAIQKGNLQLGMAQLEEAKRYHDNTAESKANKPFMQVSPDGKQKVNMSEGEFRSLYEQALKDPEFQGENLKVYMGNFENQPLEAEKNIVQAYYRKLYERGNSFNRFTQPRNAAPQTPLVYPQQDTAKPKINYGKDINY